MQRVEQLNRTRHKLNNYMGLDEPAQLSYQLLGSGQLTMEGSRDQVRVPMVGPGVQVERKRVFVSLSNSNPSRGLLNWAL